MTVRLGGFTGAANIEVASIMAEITRVAGDRYRFLTQVFISRMIFAAIKVSFVIKDLPSGLQPTTKVSPVRNFPADTQLKQVFLTDFWLNIEYFHSE